MAATEVFANQAITIVASGGTDAPASGSQETWTVASSAAFPAASSSANTQFHVCDTTAGFTGEIIAVTNVSGTTWTVTRGAESTTPVAHLPGFTIQQVTTAGFLGSVIQGVINPSGDASGATDTARIQAAINAANGPVYLLTATYYLNAPLTLVNGTQLIGLNDGGFGNGGFSAQVTELLLVNNSNCSMIVAPTTANYWKLKNLLLSANGPGQTGPVQTGATGAAIHVADTVTPNELQAEMEQVFVTGAFNDDLYLGNGRRSLRAKFCKLQAAGTGNTSNPQVGNGVTINYSDHVFYACSVGGNQNHGFSLLASNSSSIRITDCDIFTNGQNWSAGTKTTVAAGSNGQAISGLTAAGVLNVASTTGFPTAGTLFLNLSSGPVVVSYAGTTSTTFTGVAVSATAGNQGGTLATGQGVFLQGGDGIHIGTGCSGVWIGGNSIDRNYGCGINVESASQYAHHVVGNHFVSNSQAADGLLPHINLVSPSGQVAITGNGMEPVVAGATNRCNFFVYANGAGTWNDAANSYYFAALSTSAYTNNIQGIAPFSNGTFAMQGTNTGQVTAQVKQLAGQTAALQQWQDSTGNALYSLDAWGRPVVTSTGATTPSVAVGTGAGTGATATVLNGDAAGNLSVTLGTGPASGTLATVTFAHAYGSATTPVVTLIPQNTDAAHLNQFVFVAPSATGWVVSTISGVSFAGLTQPIWNFAVTGT